MPFVVIYAIAVAVLFAIAWWLDDHKRAKALFAVLGALPVAYFAYNFTEYGPHWMALLWLLLPWVLYNQGLIKPLPAILGEFTSIPYVLNSFGLIGAYTSLWWGDFLGILMIAAIGGPILAKLVGIAASRAASILGGRDIVVAITRYLGAQKWN